MYVCTDCWNESIKWQWQCEFCKEWNTLKEFREQKEEKTWWIVQKLQKIEEIQNYSQKIITKSNELNNLLWWWITPGSVILLSWEPWIWKSTITLQLWNLVKNQIIYISGEETPYQISDRAKRLKIKWNNVMMLWENCIENTLETLKDLNNKQDIKNKILVIDSISVMHSNNISWTSWSISQVRYIAELLVRYAKVTNTTIFIIWHITKDWNLAWPKTLEHMVDVVLYFEWDKYDNIRILRWLKNRFGPTNEIAIFSMWNEWLSDLKNPWLEFVNSKDPQIWSSLSITIEWTRPIIVETESLTTYTKFGYPKRSSRWINSSKLDLIIAVLSKYTTIKLESYDVYVNIARWLKVLEPWIDLSIAVSIISSKINKQISKDIIFVWEISLTWMIKKSIYLEKRIKEAEKMWFKKIFIWDTKKDFKNKDIEIVKIKNIGDLVKFL